MFWSTRRPEQRKKHSNENVRSTVESKNFGTSAQVLEEFYVTVTKKVAHPLPPIEAFQWIEQWAEFPCQPVDCELVQIGIELSLRYSISYRDAAILAAASGMGAHTVYSEDLNHGQMYGTVRVVNPFR